MIWKRKITLEALDVYKRQHYQPADGLKRVTVSCATLLERVRGEVAKRKNVKKKPIVGDGQLSLIHI